MLFVIKHIKHAINLVKHHLRDVGISHKRSPHWATLEKHFLKSNPTCAACGSSEKLNIHHIIPFHLDPSKELDWDNLITLCVKEGHHLHIGHAGSFQFYNPNVREDAKQALFHPEKIDEIIKLAFANRKG